MDNNAYDSFDIINQTEPVEDQQLEFIPKTFDEYLGQEELKKKLSVYTQAARMRNEALDHMLLFGPPGLGKTTLATIMAHVMDVNIKICTGPMLERTGDLVAILSSLEPRDILFIDEIHRMPTAIEEVLYSAMEQFRIDVIVGQGPGATTVNLPLNQFTLVGATTKSGMLSAPLRSRFGITERLDFYNEKDLCSIIEQNAEYLNVTITPEGAQRIAKSSRGTPRVAKKLLRRVRDFAQVHNDNQATPKLVEESLKFLGIDSDGLCRVDNLILRIIVENYNGGPIGLETLASLVGEDSYTIETVYEPFLLRKGLLEKTPRGRAIPYKALPHLKQKFQGQATIA